MSLAEIAHCVGGTARGDDLPVTRLCTDSRSLLSGDMFVALSGEHFDGNDFVAQARDAGAACALLSRPSGLLPEVIVDDTRLALGQLARANRRRFQGPLVALTGSSGKTSTKEMLAAILSQLGAVYATRGNLNNEIGVPLSLLELTGQHDRAVIEMGAARQGDIRYLCDFAEPDVAILTNAQPAHIAGFGSLQGVADTKGEIFTALPATGTAIINGDDQFCAQWQAMAAHCRRVLFSLEREDADVRASELQCNDVGEYRFRLHAPLGEALVSLPLPGRHMVANALAASAAAIAVGADLDAIVAGLQGLSPVAGRLCRERIAGVQLINDSYNANPGSVNAAIVVLASCAGRKILVMGAMAELGGAAEQLHIQVAERASAEGIDQLLAIGDYAAAMARHFGEGGRAFENKAALLAALQQGVQQGDVVLVKGSRSAAMETVYEGLKATLADRNLGGDS